MDWKRWLILLALLHFGFALVYASVTPYRTAGDLRYQRDPATGQRQHVQDIGVPDERQHANYIQYLLDGKGLPVFNPEDSNLYETYQRHQPPLYYLLSAGVAKITGQSDVEQRSTGLVLRGFNAILGTLSICGVFFLGLWGFKSEKIAIGAAAFAALLPMNIALSGAVTNDVLLIGLCCWALAFAAKGARDGWTLKTAIIVGVLGGLAALTKTTAIALLFAFPFFLIEKLDDGKAKVDAKSLFAAIGVMLTIAIPWWLRNQSLYGDPLALKAFDLAFKDSPKATQFIQAFGPFGYWTGLNETSLKFGVLSWTFKSLLGVFSYMDIFLADFAYILFALFLAVVFGGCIAGRKRPEIQEAARVRLGLTVFFLVILALFMRFNSQYFQAQARYLLPAIAPIAIAVSCGITALAKNRPMLGIGGMVCGFIALNIYVLTLLPGEFDQRVTSSPQALSGTVHMRKSV